ncbi:MAG TPA: hypothetical protein PLQ41_04275 [bacterium]|nr:hypothetical protein [bacterium]HPP29526.1 hypothetical protein [bacterium]
MSGCLKRWCIISFLLCRGIFSSELINDNLIPVYYTADNLEILFNQAGEPEKAVLYGNVRIAFEDIIIRCERAEFNRTTGDILGEGNLFVETPQGTVKARDITYNINERKGVLSSAVFSSPPYYGKAEKVEQEGDIFYLINGYITTCDLEKPHYRIYAGRLKYVKNEYLQAQRMKFILGEKYSVFYFPRYTVDMKTKEPLVTARPAYTSKAGDNVEVIFAQRTGAEMDAVIKERILIGEKGFGAGINIHSTGMYRGEGFLFKNWAEGDIEPALILEFLKNYRSSSGEGNILLDWRWMDNNELFYNFFHPDYIAKSKRYNYLSFTHNFRQGIFNLNFRDSPEDDFLNIEKLPEIRFYTPYFQIGEGPIFLENDFRFTNFYKEDENYLRIMDIFTLKGALEMGGLTFSPYLSLGGIEYSEETDDRFNFFREAGVKFSTTLKKEHRILTEYFSPSLTFLHRELDYKKGELEYLDYFERMDNGNFLNIGLDWFLKEEEDYIGRVSLENFYDIDSERFDTCSLKYDVKLTPYLYIEGKNEWDVDGEKYLFGFNDIIFNSGRYSYSIGNRYDEENSVSGIEGKFSQVINELWKYSTGIQYDINSDDISRAFLEVSHKIHCWELNISISGNKDDFSFFVMVYPFI